VGDYQIRPDALKAFPVTLRSAHAAAVAEATDSKMLENGSRPELPFEIKIYVFIFSKNIEKLHLKKISCVMR
jgi:hypothetical protein